MESKKERAQEVAWQEYMNIKQEDGTVKKELLRVKFKELTPSPQELCREYFIRSKRIKVFLISLDIVIIVIIMYFCFKFQ